MCIHTNGAICGCMDIPILQIVNKCWNRWVK